MSTNPLQELGYRLSDGWDWIAYYIVGYGKEALLTALLVGGTLWFLRNSETVLRERARRGDPNALADLTAKLITTTDRNLSLVAREGLMRARSGSMDDMHTLVVRLSAVNDPYFHNDKEAADLWLKRLKTFKAVLQEPGAAMQVHEGDQPQMVEPYEELNALIGLDDVKRAMTDVAARAELFEKRKAAGLPVTHPALHLIFMGNPGTGKTTVARILGRLLRRIGYLSKGHVVEVSESELIGRYIGETPIKVHQKIQMAMGGILFIDEAYSLLNADSDRGSFSSSAIATLVKYMEDLRHDLVVIAAGYPAEMKKFMDSNPGLRSRFTEVIMFEDYSPDDMVRIFLQMAKANHYVLTNEAASTLLYLMGEARMTFTHHFSNGRFVRNMFEDSITFMATRVSRITNPSKDTLMRIAKEDIAQAMDKMRATHGSVATPNETSPVKTNG